MQMKQLIFILIVFVFFIGGCKKNSSGSKPSIELKRVSPDVVPINGSMQIILSYTDGDNPIDSIFIYRKRLNIRSVSGTLNDSTKLAVPAHNDNKTGDIYLDFITDGSGRNDYQRYLISAVFPPVSGTPPRNEADTISYKIIAVDKQKIISDTVFFSPIVVLR